MFSDFCVVCMLCVCQATHVNVKGQLKVSGFFYCVNSKDTILVVRFVAGTLIHQAVSPAPIRVFQITKFKVASIRTVSDFCSEDIVRIFGFYYVAKDDLGFLILLSPISQLLGIYRSVFPPITSSFVLFLETGIYFVSRIPSLP